MNAQELRHGEVLTLVVRPTRAGPIHPPPTKGEETRLRLPGGDDDVLMSVGGGWVAIEAHDDASERRLRVLRQLDPARICWVGEHSVRDGTSVVTVVVHRFHTRYRWDTPLVLAVDERVVSRVAKLARRALSSADVCAWLTERVLMPANGDRPRLIATGAPDSGRFRLLGRGIGVDVSPNPDALLVETVVQLRQARQGFRPPEFLIEADVHFEDATTTGKVRPSVRAQLERIVAESDNSYLALWQRYQDIEKEQLARKARELGWVEYTRYEPLPSGLWAFQVASQQQLAGFEHRLDDNQELEAGEKLPPELMDADKKSEDEPADRPFIGTVARVRWDRSQLLLRPLDEDSDSVPPSRGYLFLALQGDRKRLARRNDAVQRLRSADARIPRLALIIENQPAPMRRTDKVPVMSIAARRIFRDEPTPAQRDAIDQALNTPDIALIQGPPGTGKTTVIAAVLVRLAELEAEEEAVSGRTLLTSYQHDAVDNAVERSTVFGLPPARFGGRRGSRAVDDQADRWAAKAHEDALAVLSTLDEGRPHAEYRHFRDRVAAYGSGQLQPEEVLGLLDDLLALDPGALASEHWDRLRALRRRSRSGGAVDVDRSLSVKAARGIPPQNTAFIDWARGRACGALKQLAPILADAERALLERAAAVPEGEPFSEIDALAKLREALLDRLDPATVPGQRGGRDPELMEALNIAIACLYTRMEKSRGGVADALQEYADAIRLTPGEVIRTLRHYSAVYAASCQQSVGQAIAESRGADQDLWFENVVVDEAARANPLDLFIPISLGKRRVILVGDHRQLPHLLEPDIERQLSEGASEALERALKRSLFERLFEDLRAREQADGVRRVVTLDRQFRMHPTLGRFVSDTFYPPHEGFASPRPAKEFAHGLGDWMKGGRPVCAAWKRLPNASGAEERVGTSWGRRAEATWIAGEVRRLIEGAGHDLTIGVISFYKPQVEFLLDAMVGEGLAERDPDTDTLDITRRFRTLDRDGKQVERLRVGTVDAFQGMEFDVVFLSVVRSNAVKPDTKEALPGKYGHLLLPNRLCVAMSRQMRLLVAVGDHEMFEGEEAAAAVPGLARFLELCGGEDGLVA